MAEGTFTNIDPSTLPEDLQKLYKNMEADYTRKRQEESARLRDMELQLREQEQRINESNARLMDYKNANDEWVEWSKTIAEIQSPTADTGAGYEPDSSWQRTVLPGGEQALARKRTDEERLIMELAQKNKKLESELTKMSTAMDVGFQLDELRHEYPGIDAKKVVDTALKLRIPDLRKARDIAYQEEDMNKRIEEQVAARVAEERERERTRVLETSKAVPFEIFAKMPERPRSFEEASEEILRNLRGSSNNLPT